MNYALATVLGWLLLPACQSKHENTRTETTAADTSAAPVAAAPSLAQRFGPIIRGAWVNANYLTVLQKTKSPILAFDSAGYISEMAINPSAATADSLVAGVGLGNHEGGGMSIYFRAGQQPNTLLTNHRDFSSPGSHCELGYRLGARDTLLILTTFNANQQILSRAFYRRIQPGQLDELNNLNKAVNQLLMAGEYVGQDSLHSPARLIFRPDGHLIGWRGVNAYEVNTDFGSGPGNDIDHLILKDADESSPLIHFQFRADSLFLYRAYIKTTKQHPGTDDESVAEELTRGKLLFALVRKS